jgi:hypothetical protein
MGKYGLGGRIRRARSVLEQRAAALGRARPEPCGVRVETQDQL